MIKKLIIVAISLSGLLLAGSGDESFIAADRKYNLNYKILKAIAAGESGLNSNLISFVLSDPYKIAIWDDFVSKYKIKIKKSPYKKGVIYSVYPQTSQMAIAILPAVKKITYESSYDLGIMQINSQNIKDNGWDEARLLTDTEYNVDKGAFLLNDCRTKFGGDVAKTIECYNKGYKQKNFDFLYFSKIQTEYLKSLKTKEYSRIATKEETAQSLPPYTQKRTFF